MRTRLEKGLGLQVTETSAGINALMRLALKGKIAGDTYYLKMDKLAFDQAMKGDEGEDYYQMYVQQRALGLEAFQNEVITELGACLGTGLHQIVRCHNYDSGQWLLMQVVNHPKCEFATALTIYWANQPNYHYLKYENLEQASQDTKNLSRETALLLNQIEVKAKLGKFMRSITVPDRNDLSDFLDRKNFDYANKPFIEIPVELRI
ncbi:DUF4274 domain-containing protein [Iodobacter sp. HSC-16F04]|uniref:DUF4274 domain-containing protein n=1 Tax=Iodobacter violaceini TaxID=3044271 RepID=A0ABX0KUJ9_9NEIS|nr:DUF4274 domain-containing protein [Iodobacter violacea]NHQ86137.1 DUF4274 domain-containing protein [Iodobacter violacea]